MNSPFTPFTPADSGRTELTVGDILPGLPLEALNNRQVPLNQPLHLADEIVERALSSGQPAIPLFEIYRVCPALFPAPISPEDKRAVPIPPHKIAGLIPKSGPSMTPGAGAGAGASPFAIAPPGSAPGFAGGPAAKSLFSPFVQPEQPTEDTDSSTTLFQPSPFNFGAPAQAPKPEQGPAASPFGLVGGSPESGPGALAPGMPNPFAPTSASSFSSMAFGSAAPAPSPAGAPLQGSPGPGPASPFSFGTPNLPPAAPAPPQGPAPAPEAGPLHSPFAAALPDPARQAPSPFDFASPTKPPASGPESVSPFALITPAPIPAPVPESQQPSSSLWSGGSPFSPNAAAVPSPAPPGPLHSPFAPESGPVSLPPSMNSPFGPSAPPPSAPAGPPTGNVVAPSWMPTPAKPGIGASPFAGFAVPPPVQPAPLAPLPPEHGSAVPDSLAPADVPSPAATASPAAAAAPVETQREPAPASPTPGMPAFPGFAPATTEGTPAHKEPNFTPFQPGPGPANAAPSGEPALPPLQPGPFSPAPELFRPAQPPAGMNPFERIQALSRAEASSGAPSEERGKEPAPSPAAETLSPAAPFAAPAPSLPTASVPTGTPASGPPPEATPEKAAPAPPPAAAAPAPSPGPISSPVFAPAPELRPMPPLHSAAHGTVEKVSLSLASVLKSCKTHEIGMSPDHIPSWVRVNLPLDLIRPQLLSGKVTLRVTQVMAALDPELRNLITPSRPDLSVDLSMSELRKALPNEPFPEPVASAPAPAAAPPLFQPFSPSPASAGNASAPDLVFGTPTNPPPVPPFFQAAAPVENTQPTAADSAWPLPPGSPDPEPAPVSEAPELASAFSFLKEEPEVEVVAPEKNVVVDFQPVTEVSPPAAKAPEPVSTPARTSSAPASESTGITKSAIRVIPHTPATQSASQMLLRALLNTDEPLDTPSVAQLLACQPGIVAVACLRDGTCLAAAGNGSAEAEHFLNQAPKLHHHVQPLIQLTGSLDTETFSMNSGALVITFSLQSEITLGVLHDPRTQGPALRERITLIARSLTPLLNLPAA